MKVFLFGLLLLYPLAGQDTDPIDSGKALYRSNCAFCHGLTGGGGRGPALAQGNFVHGSSAAEIRRVIREGIPGTNMPAFRMEPDELDHLVAFIQAFSGAGVKRPPVAGDAARGHEVYAHSGCAGCHQVAGQGSIYGPDLSRVGAARSSQYIRDSVVNPSADIPDDYQGVTVVTRDGKRITGVRINEDTFSVQLREPSGKFRMFQKSEVREVSPEKKSLMPPYTSLSQDDLQNLLAYLDSLRGEVKTGSDVRNAEGIK
jgi:putative heme-binding domain-containing protein